MSDAKPAAWSVDPRRPTTVLGAYGRPVARGYGLSGAKVATLIAAAPDLLEAARAVLAQHDNPMRDGKTAERFDALRAAIAKAQPSPSTGGE